MKKHILIVDDEPDILELLSFHLSKKYNVSTAKDGTDALLAVNNTVDLIVLDVMMPGLNGFEVCRVIKKNPANSEIPIIFLTAKNTSDDELEALQIGAADFISKPISIKTLLLRIRNVLESHSKTSNTHNEIIFQNLKVDIDLSQVYIDNRLLKLTNTEFLLLKTLLLSPNKIFNRQELLSKVWGADAVVTDRTVDVHIAKLRKKIEKDSTIITTHHGRGYSIEN